MMLALEYRNREALGEGMGRLDDSERARIITSFESEYPDLWSSVVSDFEDESLAAEIVLAGAVVVGVSERLRPIDLEGLDLLEGDADARADSVGALALVLHSADVWSVIESGETAEAMDRADPHAAALVLALEAAHRELAAAAAGQLSAATVLN